MSHTSFFKKDLPSRVEIAQQHKVDAAKLERDANKDIDRRDSRICRACGKHSDPEATGLLKRGHRHHIIYRSAGGSDDASNRVTLCSLCHDDEHRDRLRFTEDGGPYVGIDATAGMEFWRKTDGGWYLSRREIAPHVIEKD